MNSTPQPSSTQSDLETASAPFLAFGILGCLAGLVGLAPLIVDAILGSFSVSLLFFIGSIFFYGAGLIAIGIGLRRRWRYVLPFAVVVGLPGLWQVPVGTLIYGWALYSLWKRRELFYPFDRPVSPKA